MSAVRVRRWPILWQRMPIMALGRAQANSRTIQMSQLDGSALAMMKAGYTRDELETLGYAPRLLERCAHELRQLRGMWLSQM